MRGLFLIAALVVALIGCKKSGPTKLGDDDRPAPAKCSGDADCTVIALSDCCHCCPNTEMFAVAKDGPTYERHCEGHCKVCVGPGAKDGKAASCETNLKPTDFTPVCRAGTCAYAPNKK